MAFWYFRCALIVLAILPAASPAQRSVPAAEKATLPPSELPSEADLVGAYFSPAERASLLLSLAMARIQAMR